MNREGTPVFPVVRSKKKEPPYGRSSFLAEEGRFELPLQISPY